MDALIIVFIFALIILCGIMIIWAILDIFQKNFSLTERLLWLIVIILAPILGTIIYLFLGRRIR